ncbi:MAG: hypothetical protein ABW179_10575 [Methylobacterium sp.]
MPSFGADRERCDTAGSAPLADAAASGRHGLARPIDQIGIEKGGHEIVAALPICPCTRATGLTTPNSGNVSTHARACGASMSTRVPSTSKGWSRAS